MSLKLITGAANTGKTGVVLRDAIRARDAGLSPILVVPSLEDVRRLEAELAQRPGLGIRVLVLKQLVRDVWSLQGDGRQIASGFVRESLIRAIVDGSEYRTRETAPPGLIRLVAQASREWAWAWHAGSAQQESEVSADLCKLVSHYYRELARLGFVELWAAAGTLESLRVALEGPIATVRGDSISPDEARFLVGLSAVNDVTIGVTWEKGLPGTEANTGLVEWLSARSDEHVELPEAPASAEIPSLGRRIFSAEAGVKQEGRVTFGVVSGVEEEAAAAAVASSDAIRMGVPAERIVVAFPDLARRIDAVTGALRAAGVPAGVRARRPLGTTAFGRAFLALLALSAGMGSYAEASEFALSAFSAIAGSEARALDRRWRERRTHDSRSLLSDLAKASEETARCVELARVSGGSPVNRQVAASWQKVAAAMLDLGLRDANSDPERARVIGAAYSAATLGLREIGAAPGALVPSLAEALAALAARQVAQLGEERDGEVQVCDIADVGARRFDVVILGGMTEDEFSARGNEGPLAAAHAPLDGLVEPDPAAMLRLQFYSLVTRARTKIVFIRQDSDSEGRPKRPALLWRDAVDAYRQGGENTAQDVESALVTVRLTQADLPLAAPALSVERQQLRHDAGDMTFVQPARASLSGSQASLVTERAFSATEVETYLACPYRWFYQRVVRPAQIDTEVDSREIGVYAHGVLADYYSALRATGTARVTPETVEASLGLLGEVCAARRNRVPVDGSVAEEMAVSRAERWVRNVVGQDAGFMPGFAPSHTEFSFGDEEPFEFAGARFHGRIDRIDTTSELAFVTDYKSSRSVTGLARFERDGKVQAVIYALAAEHALGVAVCGSAYRSMSSGNLGGFWRTDLLGEMPLGMCEDEGLDGSGFGELVGRTAERVAEALAGMRSGAIARRPRTGACAYCPVAAVCEGAVG